MTENERWHITKEKLKSIILKLKNRKAPETDHITNEMLKYGGDELLKELHFLYNKILTRKEISNQWRESTTIPIFKKGAKADPNN